MINRTQLLSDLQKLLQRLEKDLLERSESADVPEVGKTLRAEYDRAKTAERTAQNYEDWRTDAITQAAAAWVLSCVFVRFLEDNRLIDPPKIAGPTAVEPRPSGSGSSSTGNKAPLPDGRGSTENRLERARDEHELYFRNHPKQTDREYLLAVFDPLAKLPGTKDLFGEHNPIRELPNWLSGDAAGELLKFFQKIEANSGLLVHDFTCNPEPRPLGSGGNPPLPHGRGSDELDTRFLGDLYQDLSEAARKKFALLQTPEFVEEFILERTLEPALEEFGLEPALAPGAATVRERSDAAPLPDGRGSKNIFKMIDPACGSGHFLLGSFRRILDRWQRREPGTNVRELVQRTLDSVHGVDVNPFAIAIARFRLLLAAMRACGIARLADAPAFRLNLVCGDSLLHAPLAAGGKKYTAGQQELDFALVHDFEPRPSGSGSSSDDQKTPLPDGRGSENFDECDHAYRSENLPELKRLLRGGQYHAVVANPPYIVPRDKQLNERYRKRFASCHRQYSLAVPFLERIFRLAVAGGYTGQITANSFMKREFGKKLIESFFPTVDLTHVIDSSGAYIPGHGTPTVILFGRHRSPVASTLRTVMGIRGEPSTPDDPAHALVWSAIVEQLDQPGSQSEFVSVGDSPREMFHKHPWSIGGGGAAELKELLETSATRELGTAVIAIGRIAHTGDDDAYIAPRPALQRRSISPVHISAFVEGDRIRDYRIVDGDAILFPYDEALAVAVETPQSPLFRWLWHFRTELWERREPNGNHREIGKTWYEFSRFHPERYVGAGIAFAFVATHNHFALDRGDKVFKQSAPVIKLPRDASEDDYLALLGLLNSSTACFWMKQVFHDKGSTVDAHGARQATVAFENFREFTSTGLLKLPLPADRPLLTARLLDILATRARDFQPASIASRGAPTRAALDTAKDAAQFARSKMIAYQEELDWECYRLYGLIAEDLTYHPTTSSRDREGAVGSAIKGEDRSLTVAAPRLALGQRAFEIVLARKMAAGETQTTWFERHGSTPITELPAEWPDDYRQLVERRIALIASDPNIRLIEQPEYKRRWNTEPWDTQLERALREWLLDRLESYFDFDGRMTSRDTPASSRDREGAVRLAINGEDRSLTVAAPDAGSSRARQEAGEDAIPALLDEDWQGACRTISKAEIEPQSYFVTFTCYGTWLHGDERGSIDLEHNDWQTPPLEPDEERERREFALLKHSPVKLGPKQRLIVHRTIEEVCQHRGWCLHALNVRTNHVHVVVTANRRGKRVYNDFKSYATRHIKEEGCVPEACLEVFGKDRFLTGAAPKTDSSRDREGAVSSDAEPEFKVWTRGGSARPINTENSFRRAVEYTLREQGPDITPGVSSEDRFLTGAAPDAASSRDREGAVGSVNAPLPDGRGSKILDIALVSVAKLADVARQDAEFQQVGELFRDDPAFDVQKLVEELVAAECVPLLPVLRYKPSGLIKRGVWERTWDLQRQEDAIDARTKLPSTDPQHLSADAARDLKQKQVGNIPVPTKYDSKDFLDSNRWRLRGKLDVPKERWINFPHCEGPDGTPVIAWAGYDHLQQAKAISAYYVDIQERLGGRDDPRLIPLLAGMLELLPWLKQWHNDPDATFDGMRMGDYFDTFATEEARQLSKTIPEIKAWTPPKKVAKGQRGRGAKKGKVKEEAEE